MTSTFLVAEADAIDWLSDLPSDSADLVITDPPYESLEKHRARGTTTRLKHSKSSSNDWFKIFPNNRFDDLMRQVYRILRKNSHFYLFCDQETMFVAKPAGEKAGFRFWKPLIWDKQKIGMGYHYRSRYECILFFEKGKRRLANLGTPDVLSFARVHNGYPTEKPVPLIDVLVRQSSSEGEVVLDPFLGSGSTGVAAVSAGRSFQGCDLSSTAIGVATARLREAGATELSRREPTHRGAQLGLNIPPDN
jgi:site-specific DNA-methyltransferase (adenine-specific)